MAKKSENSLLAGNWTWRRVRYRPRPPPEFLLLRKGTEGLVAGEIASALEIPPTNLSFHLKALTQARLVTVEQEGRVQRYRANMPLTLDLIGYLTAECCAGHPEECADVSAALSRSHRVASPDSFKGRKKVKP